MRTSESLKELASALALAQGEFPTIAKTKTGKIEGEGKRGHYEYSYKYADLVDVVKAVQPILAKNGLSVTQPPEFVDGQEVLTTRLLHSSGEWMESSMLLHLAKVDAQGQGSAITYARRYAECGVLGIVADEDDDGKTATTQQSTRTRSAPAQARQQATPAPAPTNGDGKITTERAQEIVKAFADKGLTERDDYLNIQSMVVGRTVPSTKDLTPVEANKVLRHVHSIPVAS